MKHGFNELLSWKDPKFTVKCIIVLKLSFITAWMFGDFTCLMIMFNSIMLFSLAYQKKQAQMDRLLTIFDENLEAYIKLLPFISKSVDVAKK
jgi:hypothetical protein